MNYFKLFFMFFSCIGAINASQDYDTQESCPKRLKTDPSQTAMLMIYHRLNAGSSVQSVQEHGLLSFSQAYSLGLVSCSEVPKIKLDRRKTEADIYFSPVDDGQCEIAYQVPLANLFVQNGAYRKYRQWIEYNQSKVPLEHYLQATEKMKTLQQQYPGKTFKLDPIFCTVQCVISKKIQRSDRAGRKIQSSNVVNYNPEVVVPAGCIPPEQLIFLK